ncbi:MAG: UvrD-helicase domain-containing protein [Dehalococcoidia bacterium]|nr:UvrD-helicase domain-containing protein [Dehalococcoidia bacterium]
MQLPLEPPPADTLTPQLVTSNDRHNLRGNGPGLEVERVAEFATDLPAERRPDEPPEYLDAPPPEVAPSDVSSDAVASELGAPEAEARFRPRAPREAEPELELPPDFQPAIALEELTGGLNEAQRRAVEAKGGGVLILAGPGSGKTRVIAHRVAYLVNYLRVPPWRILGVTFTNKAAREMRERVERLLGDRAAQLHLGTFHSVCARILRRDGHHIGIPNDFVIYDTDDQMALVRQIEAELQIDPKRFPPRQVLSAISSAKNERLDVERYRAQANSYFEEVVGRVYASYEAALRRNGATDFDDLLSLVLQLFEQVPEVRDAYAGRYLHVLIDEFQDTNIVQYELSRLLASRHHNITAVGDPDQSIYSWRAADIRNLQRFETDFPGTQVILLEQNYRSTGHILQAAHAVIAKSEGRPEKALWTENPEGQLVMVHEARSGEDEAMYIASEINRLARVQQRSPADFAVMYRTNAQSRAFEEAMLYLGLPYRLVGGTRFYDRKEVRDLLAYLRLVHNEWDGIAFTRIVNVPARGVGPKTVERILQAAVELGISPLAVAHRMAAGERDAGLPEVPSVRARQALESFVVLIDRLSQASSQRRVADLIDDLLSSIGYRKYLEEADQAHAEARWENVEELINVSRQYDDLDGSSLAAFLEEVALVSDVDDPSADRPDAVTLTSLHSAKGLEFPVVFMPGMEEGVLPHSRSLEDPKQMEEERRVCYVGMTRAQERLYLLSAATRFQHGMLRRAIPSRFLRDLPHADIERPEGERGLEGTSARERRAAIAARAPREVPSEPAYSGGDRVEHARFGRGVVVSCELSGGDQMVTVAFDGAGVKKLALSLAPLTRLDAPGGDGDDDIRSVPLEDGA